MYCNLPTAGISKQPTLLGYAWFHYKEQFYFSICVAKVILYVLIYRISSLQTFGEIIYRYVVGADRNASHLIFDPWMTRWVSYLTTQSRLAHLAIRIHQGTCFGHRADFYETTTIYFYPLDNPFSVTLRFGFILLGRPKRVPFDFSILG